MPIDRPDRVARLDAGDGGCAPRAHGADERRQLDLAVSHEQAAQYHQRKQEICSRSRGHHERTLIKRLERKHTLALMLTELRELVTVRCAGGILVAEEFHITAKG